MDSFVAVTDYGNGGYKVVIVATILIIMQMIMVAGRFVSQKLQKVFFAIDDYVLLMAMILTIALCAVAFAFPRIAGVGSHIGYIQMKTPSESKLVGQTFIAWSILYGLSIAFSKGAILLLYVRIFTTRMRAFTITANLVGFVIVATCVANTFASIFQCSPTAYEWDKSIQGGTCINEIAFARYMAIPNVVTGAVMLVMPLPLVWQLNVNVAAKVALTATFLHGIIGFIASCARLSFLFSTNAHTFSSNTSFAWTIWTINEPANYIIAACLPTLRPVFMRILPNSFFLLSKKRSSKPYTSSLKVSWPRGSIKPQFRLETRVAETNSQITGPWNSVQRVEVARSEEELVGVGANAWNGRKKAGIAETVVEVSEGVSP